MRILYVAAGMPIPGEHGGSVHAMQLAAAMAAAGHEVHLVALPGEGDDTLLANVRLHTIDPIASVDQLEWLRARQVRRVAEQVRPDVVLERFYTFGGTGLKAAGAIGVPAVLEVNSPARPYPGSLRDALDRFSLVRPVARWRRWMLDHAAAFVATSAVLLPEPEQERTTVIVNGVDVERVTPGEPAPDDGPLRCVYVSSFRDWHGAEDLVEAMGIAVAAGARLHLTCIGEGPRYKAARALASRGPAAGLVKFLGRVPHADVAGHLARASVGVAPFSPAEHRALELGWFWSPIKIFEYLAAGLPVVTADIPELRALLNDQVARYYTAGRADDLAAALMSLDGDRASVRAAGAAARELAVARYTWDHQAQRVLDVLERVVAG